MASSHFSIETSGASLQLWHPSRIHPIDHGAAPVQRGSHGITPAARRCPDNYPNGRVAEMGGVETGLTFTE